MSPWTNRDKTHVTATHLALAQALLPAQAQGMSSLRETVPFPEPEVSVEELIAAIEKTRVVNALIRAGLAEARRR